MTLYTRAHLMNKPEWEAEETAGTAGNTAQCICLRSPWTYLNTPPHTPTDSPNHRHDDLLHSNHRCLGDLLLSNCHLSQQQAGHMGGSHTNCSHTATPPSPSPPLANRTPQLWGKNSTFRWTFWVKQPMSQTTHTFPENTHKCHSLPICQFFFKLIIISHCLCAFNGINTQSKAHRALFSDKHLFKQGFCRLCCHFVQMIAM